MQEIRTELKREEQEKNQPLSSADQVRAKWKAKLNPLRLPVTCEPQSFSRGQSMRVPFSPSPIA